MKILHTSDWHLGRSLYEYSLIEEQEHALNQILRIIESGDWAALILAGDVFDRSIAPTEALDLFSSFLARLRASSDLPVIIISGNHDSPSRLAFCADILRSSQIHCITDPLRIEPVSVEKNGETAHIWPIPFLHPNTFNSHGEEGEDSGRASHDKAVSRALASFREILDPKAINICTAHFFASDGKASDSERAFVGTLGEVDISPFEIFDYTALGHLHRPQAVKESITYSGSPLKYSFSEAEDVKGLTAVEVSKGRCHISRIPILPIRDMRRLKGSFAELMSSARFSLYKEDYIEAELTDTQTIPNAIANLKSRFPNILSVRQNRISISGKTYGEISLSSASEDGKISVEDDYRLFHKYIYGRAPGEEELSLFKGILKESGELSGS